MKAFDNILQSVGRTPLVRLRRLVGPSDAAVYAKCEFLNPGGSVKDRMVCRVLDGALAAGEIKPGGTVVENTSGNTGAAVALWAAVNGVRCVLTIPDKMSQEKIDTLKGLGAQVTVTPTNVPADSPDSYYETAKRIHRETPGSYYLNQYHNRANIEAHYHSTGPEVWQDTDGSLDAFVAGIGTGGTMSGAGRYLKEQRKDVLNVAVDPVGSVFYDLFKSGELPTPHVYKVEGIGEDMPCEALDFSVIDDIRQVDDRQSFVMARRLAREEGIFAGGSSGSAIHVALDVARDLGPGKVVVALLPDGGKSYISKFYSDEWMYDNGFISRGDSLGTVGEVLEAKGRQELVTVGQTETVGDAVARLKQRDISQMPVLDQAGVAVGMLHEIDLLDALVAGKVGRADPVQRVSQPLQGTMSKEAPIERLHEVLSRKGLVAVVLEGTRPVGLLTKIDLIDFVTKRGGR